MRGANAFIRSVTITLLRNGESRAPALRRDSREVLLERTRTALSGVSRHN